MHIIPSATLRGRDPLSLARTATLLGFGTAKAWLLLGRITPSGRGRLRRLSDRAAAARRDAGATSRPCCTSRTASWAAPIALLAPRVTAIATGFPIVKNLDRRLQGKITFTGNPVRPQVIAAAATALRRAAADGDAQPARVRRQPGRARDVGDRAGGDRAARRRVCARGSPSCSRRGPRISTHVRATYARLGVAAEVAPFFADLPARMAAAHLVVSRSGASTVAELSAIGRPAILVPLPHALDQDQFANAGVSGDRRRRDPHRAARLHARAAGQQKSRRCRMTPRGLQRWPQGAKSCRHDRCRRTAGRPGNKGGGNLSIGPWPVLFRPSMSCMRWRQIREARGSAHPMQG